LIARLGHLLARAHNRQLKLRRFQAHLITEFEAIFSFLFEPTVDATQWRAEQALRPASPAKCTAANPTARARPTRNKSSARYSAPPPNGTPPNCSSNSSTRGRRSSRRG
jgi:uncharacterized membrane protein YccC